ncbi:MAG: nickel pincer cofactor biosynthesis protein LarB [Smithellaceae bacterium]|nr:nickel pincer cofactor biosynthesis protein LarB [Smithellaceae bacterium]
MNTDNLKSLLGKLAAGKITVEGALDRLRGMPFEDLGFAKLDHHRQIRKGFPEVVYCPGKAPDQVVAIIGRMAQGGDENILATRAGVELYDLVKARVPEAEYHERARLIVVRRGEQQQRGHILVISAGTADQAVAEEAAVTAEVMGNRVERLYDVGVAGIHRLLSHTDRLFAARVLIVVAGMEGALPSVVGGLVDKPVIAVPTSVGYGANFGGLSALLTMLNTCASGVSVVNIDNGFGAAYQASMINRLGER